MRVLSLDEFKAELAAQGVAEAYQALVCPMCKTVQAPADFEKAGINRDLAARNYGFNCIGRLTGAGEFKKDAPPGRGCNWSLGGLFRIHKLEVEHEGHRHPMFELATPEQAQAHMKELEGASAVPAGPAG